MNLLSIPVAIVAGISFYVAFVHAVLYINIKDRSILYFSISSFIIFLYDIFCCLLYNAGSINEGVIWQRFQIVSLTLISIFLLLFTAEFTRNGINIFIKILISIFVVNAAIFMSVWGPLTLSPETPLVKTIELSSLFKIIYYEAVPGILILIQSFFGMIGIIYSIVMLINYFRKSQTAEGLILLSGFIIIFVTVVLDTFISIGTLHFVYTIEYGYIALLIAMAVTVTSRQSFIQKNLYESRENLSATLNSIGDGVIVTDGAGVIVRMNPVAEELTGWPLNEAMGRRLESVYATKEEQTNREIPNPVEKVIKRGKIVGLANHTILRDRNGKEMRIADCGTPIYDANKDITGVVLVFRDITNEYNLQEQLRQAQKMESIGKLAGGIAHDFNNYLTTIMGYSDMLLIESEALSDNVRSGITEIRKSTGRAAELTQQLLSFSRKQILKLQSLSINVLISNMENMLRRVIGEEISLDCSLASDAGFILADQYHIEQIVMNLVINSREAMPSGGTLTVETGNIYADENFCNKHQGLAPGSYVFIRVGDTGTGMSEDILPHIFDPFFTTKEIGKGTGLGLAVVYGIVKQSNGYIFVESELEVGTSFFILFPVSAGVEQKPEKENKKQALRKGNESILLVEDEESVRKMLQRLLAANGYHVYAAPGAAEALQICELKARDAIDLMITDIVMPGMNGYRLAEKVKLEFPHIKILFMSGYADDMLMRQGMLNHDSDFMQKPFESVDLLKKLSEILEK